MSEQDAIIISHEFDNDGNELEEQYVVHLTGKPADAYQLSDDYFDGIVNAHEFADEVSQETSTKITWDCIRPSWV